MAALSDCIAKHKDRIYDTIHIGFANWDGLLEVIERQELAKLADFVDEQVWTFLVGCAYAMQGMSGTHALAQVLIGATPASEQKAWFEVLPLSPRSSEGKTHLDLALGTIDLRKGTASGIELRDVERSWVCFVECKWYSDISNSVSYARHRNQLARVIENGLYFSRGDRFAQEVHVTLVTPEVFKSRAASSRLYQYKYAEYSDAQTSLERLAEDLEASCLKLQPRLPSIKSRLPCLLLHWISYETLFQNATDSELKQPFLDFAARSNGTRTVSTDANEGLVL
jgi:hypothetical protein